MTHVLGIDIGGTGIKGAPVDTDTGELLTERFRIPTPDGGRPDDVAEVVGRIVANFSWAGPIGCGFPAVVKDGHTLTAANVDPSWIGADAAGVLGAACGGPVTVANDADVAGLAEMRFGAGAGRDGVVVMVTLGTGIGSAVFHDGVLVPNTELGHLEIDGHDAETRAAASVRDNEDLSWKSWAKRVDEYLDALDRLLWPDLVIIGGGVSKNAEKFLPHLTTRAEVVAATLVNNAGIVGAALVAGHPVA